MEVKKPRIYPLTLMPEAEITHFNILVDRIDELLQGNKWYFPIANVPDKMIEAVRVFYGTERGWWVSDPKTEKSGLTGEDERVLEFRWQHGARLGRA